MSPETATPSTPAVSRSNTATCAPDPRSRAAAALPMPLAPPVTRAGRPEKS